MTPTLENLMDAMKSEPEHGPQSLHDLDHDRLDLEDDMRWALVLESTKTATGVMSAPADSGRDRCCGCPGS